MMLYELYRPKRLSQLVGQEKVTSRLRAIMGRRNWDRDAWWIEGDSGKGKTTIAEAVARQLGALRTSKNAWSYMEIDGDKCAAEQVRGLDDQVYAAGLFEDQWRVFVINEAHAMTARAVQAWLTLLERLPKRWLIIFTTTASLDDLFGDFNHPFGSRVKRFKLTNQGLCEKFARLAHRIAAREGLNGKAYGDYIKLVKDSRNNMREVLQRIDALEMMDA